MSVDRLRDLGELTEGAIEAFDRFRLKLDVEERRLRVADRLRIAWTAFLLALVASTVGILVASILIDAGYWQP